MDGIVNIPAPLRSESALSVGERRGRTLKARNRLRKEQIRAAVFQENADIDQIAKDFKRPPHWAGIVKDLLKPRPHFTLISEKHGVKFGVVRSIANVLNIEPEGRTFHRAISREEIVREVILRYRTEKLRFIANYLSEHHSIKLTSSNIYRKRENLIRSENGQVTKTVREPPLSTAERKEIVERLLGNPGSSLRRSARELGHEFIKVFKLARHYWIPTKPSGKGLDTELFLDAARELVGRELTRSAIDRRAVMDRYLRALPDPLVHSIKAQIRYFKGLSHTQDHSFSKRGVRFLPGREFDDCAVECLQMFSSCELGEMIDVRLKNGSRTENSLMARFDCYSPLSSAELFLRSAMDHYLVAGGASEDLPQQSEKGITHLQLSADPYALLQYGFALQRVYFNRLNVRLKHAYGVDYAPSCNQLEAKAHILRHEWQARRGAIKLAS